MENNNTNNPNDLLTPTITYNAETNTTTITVPRKKYTKLELFIIELCKQCDEAKKTIPEFVGASKSKLSQKLSYIRQQKDNLAPEILQLLDSRGMVWKARTPLTESAKEIIAWCKQTGKTIADIPTRLENKKQNPTYAILCILNRELDNLEPELQKELIECGLKLTRKGRKTIQDRYQFLVDECARTGKKLSQFSRQDEQGKDTELYYSIKRLRQFKSELTPEQISVLSSLEMPWAEGTVKPRIPTKPRKQKSLLTKVAQKVKTQKEEPPTSPKQADSKTKPQTRQAQKTQTPSITPTADIVVLEQTTPKKVGHSTNKGFAINRNIKLLLDWCAANNCNLQNVPSKTNNGKPHPIYLSLIYICKNRENLTPEQTEELNKLQIPWAGRKKTRFLRQVHFNCTSPRS